jgi:hypothetical protein
MPQPRRAAASGPGTEKQLPALSNAGYFSEYYLAHRLDAGLAELYARWDALEKLGEPTDRTRVRGLSSAFAAHRSVAELTAPDADMLDAGTLLPGELRADAKAALLALDDAILTALGWEPDRYAEPLELVSGEKTIIVPAAHVARTPTGVLLVALDTVFATDPAAVIASKATPAGQLVEPLLLNGKPAAKTVLAAAQLVFTADDPPSYLLFVSGGAITLLDRERWGEGISLGVNLDDAVARRDAKPKGELAAISALFGAGAINPGDQAQSVLTGLLEKASTESAGVSKELRHGIRRSVELLANAVVEDVRERQKGKWTALDPRELTRQSLRYLYRVIVLLFAEARPELGILPVDDPDYQAGYSVARLRDVALTDLLSDHALHGRHIQHSLDVLFRLVNEGHAEEQTLGDDARDLVFPGLRSELFSPASCALLDRAHLSDEILQQVMQHLCFTRERAGRGRQPVSYSTLGINQLGAVYEGLMAYSGFLATEPLYEIDKDGDPDNGSWVIPVERAGEFPEQVFLMEPTADGGERRVRYEEGDFVFRLSGRDRQRSASYYTPEVLTEFTVRHALEVLFEENAGLTAGDILELTVCEPALGSGAFLTEAIAQLAERYLKAAQDESGEVIDADRYQLELQRAKAHFAVNQSYGVDLNLTAVELAEVSLWLACMHDGLQAPWFGARLRRGNSLVGARRDTYTRAQAARSAWVGKTAIAPTPVPIAAKPLGQAGGIHHFLLPGQGWGAATEANEVKELEPDWVEAVKKWRRAIHNAPTARQLDRLESLSARVEELWAESAAEVGRFWKATRQHIDVWGADTPKAGERFGEEAIRTVLSDPRSATSRLRAVMDAWCSLWLWAPQHGTGLPSLDRWLTVVEALLRIDEPWDSDALFADDRELTLPDGASIEDIAEAHPWFASAREVAATQGWFHWELEFAPVFMRGGFDLQVGNPPWVRPTWDEPASLAETNPRIVAGGRLSEEEYASLRSRVLGNRGARARYVGERCEVAALAVLLTAPSRDRVLATVQPNLYMHFIRAAARRASTEGVVGLLHPEGHFSDPAAADLRAAVYARLRRHWHFAYARRHFDGLEGENNDFGVHVYGSERDPAFLHCSFLHQPRQLDRSLLHDGSGETPGIRFVNGEADTRPHAARVVKIDTAVLADWASLFDDEGTAPTAAKLLRPVSTADLETIQRAAGVARRLGNVPYQFTTGLHEKGAKVNGTIIDQPTAPATVTDLVLQGAHIVNGSAFAQELSEHGTWVAWSAQTARLPRSGYSRAVSSDTWLARQPRWSTGAPFTSFARAIHREYVGPGAVRSLQAALLPPGPTHIGSVVSISVNDSTRDTVYWSGLMMSLPYDYLFKLMGVSHVKDYVTRRFPFPPVQPSLESEVVMRAARLACVSADFADIWRACWQADDSSEAFIKRVATTLGGSVGREWNEETPLRVEAERWEAMCELDVLAALALNIPMAGLVAAYTSMFPVLRRYESETYFDVHGSRIARDRNHFGYVQAGLEAQAKKQKTRNWVKVWDRVEKYVAGEATVDVAPLVPPFKPADRVAAMTHAYWTFVKRYDLTPPDIAERPS